MKKIIFAFLVSFMMTTAPSFAADATLKWDASVDATGYKIYKSIDNGVTWDAGIDVGNVLTYNYTGIEETVLVIFRVSAYNLAGETINYWSGAWFNYLWLPPLSAQGLGVEEIS